MSLGISSSPTAFERAAASESSSASVHAPRRRITYVFMSSPYLVHGARFSLVASARTGDCPSQSYDERNCGCTAYAGGMSTRVRPPVLRTVRAPLRVGALVAALAVLAATAAIYPLKHLAPVVSLSVVYLPAVLLVSVYWGLGLGLATSL